MLGELFSWRWDWERIHPNVAHEILVDPAISICVDESGVALYPTIIFYSGIQQARQSLLYNTALFLLLELADDLGIEDLPLLALSGMTRQDRPVRSNPLTLPHEALSSAEAFSEIYRSIEYCLQEPHAAIGATFLLQPLGALLERPQANKEWHWLSRITKTVADLSGLDLSRLPQRLKSSRFLVESGRIPSVVSSIPSRRKDCRMVNTSSLSRRWSPCSRRVQPSCQII